jgi:hypothetical protein
MEPMDEVSARRRLWGSAVTVWCATAVAAVLVFAAVRDEGHAWLAVVLGGAVLLSFAIQLGMPGPGLVNRMLAGVGGAVVILAVASGIGDLVLHTL